ncbi:MAG: hypothetical protein IPJ34_37525 [Myxococcales bacterium]|nr:hypothetical protein [Myxococcales bacterium]
MESAFPVEPSPSPGSGGDAIEHLRSCVRGELAAAEAYAFALTVDRGEPDREQLAWCQRSHEARVHLISEHLRSLGGEAPTSPRSIGRVVGIGPRNEERRDPSLQVLEAYENLRLRDYGRDVGCLEGNTQAFLANVVFPAQLETHRMLQLVKRHRASATRAL